MIIDYCCIMVALTTKGDVSKVKESCQQKKNALDLLEEMKDRINMC